MNILFTVCGRAGSKGCKNKNTRQFLGQPLFIYTLRAIELFKQKNIADHIDTIVSTDSEDFIKLITESEFIHHVLVMKRDNSLAGDTTAKMLVIKDALKKAEAHFNKEYDLIIDLDITSPIRTIKDIERAVHSAVLHTDVTCVFSAVESRRNPYFNMVTERDGKYVKVIESNYTARQQAPRMYDMNASIYVYKKDFLLSDAYSPLQGNPSIVEVADTGIIDIDSDEDFELMQVIAEYLISTDHEYKSIFSLGDK